MIRLSKALKYHFPFVISDIDQKKDEMKTELLSFVQSKFFREKETFLYLSVLYGLADRSISNQHKRLSYPPIIKLSPMIKEKQKNNN